LISVGNSSEQKTYFQWKKLNLISPFAIRDGVDGYSTHVSSTDSVGEAYYYNPWWAELAWDPRIREGTDLWRDRINDRYLKTDSQRTTL
jgi:hypothetical protein